MDSKAGVSRRQRPRRVGSQVIARDPVVRAAVMEIPSAENLRISSP